MRSSFCILALFSREMVSDRRNMMPIHRMSLLHAIIGAYWSVNVQIYDSMAPGLVMVLVTASLLVYWLVLPLAYASVLEWDFWSAWDPGLAQLWACHWLSSARRG